MARARQAKLSRVGSAAAEEKREEEEEEELQREEDKEDEDTSTVRRMKSSNTASTSQVGLNEMKPKASDSPTEKSPDISQPNQKEISPAFITPPESTDSPSGAEPKNKDANIHPTSNGSENLSDIKPVRSVNLFLIL